MNIVCAAFGLHNWLSILDNGRTNMPTPSTTALITGAGSGIGQELARQLACAGWRIAALDADPDGLQTLTDELRRRDSICSVGVVDVTDAVATQLQVDRWESELGPIDLAVTCAGISDATPACAMDAVEIEKIIRINLIGASNTLAAVVPWMLRRQRGHVAAVSSLAAMRGLPRMMAYCASKAGLNALLESFRLDVAGRGIDVTIVCPGWTKTPQTEGRYRPKDLMTVEATAAEIIWAIHKRKRLHAFPRHLVWQMSCMRLLPRSWQDWLLCRRIDELQAAPEPKSSAERSLSC
jgi:NAD(P)-dependent dehydrogenase (short-subunit alcohol dehydrogenase family)